jgi:predicted nuclease of predicted toxin-antitoxin system
VKELGWQGRSDYELLDEAYRLGRIVLTHDGDFGTLALLGQRPIVGIVRICPGHIRSEISIRAVEQLLALALDPSPPFLAVDQGGLVRLRTWG